MRSQQRVDGTHPLGRIGGHAFLKQKGDCADATARDRFDKLGFVLLPRVSDGHGGGSDVRQGQPSRRPPFLLNCYTAISHADQGGDHMWEFTLHCVKVLVF